LKFHLSHSKNDAESGRNTRAACSAKNLILASFGFSVLLKNYRKMFGPHIDFARPEAVGK
jgi:hypothetical protein